MRAFSFLALASTVAFSAPADAGSAPLTSDVPATDTTVVAPAADKPAKQPRKLRAKAKPADKPVVDAPAPAPVVEPTAPVAAEPAVKPLPIARTCATIARQATNFGNLSDRDLAYIAFYAGFAKAAADGIVTVRAIADAFAATGARPNYSGSSKPHDAGVIVRLTKAGLIVPTESDGTAFRFTDAAKTHKAYAQA